MAERVEIDYRDRPLFFLDLETSDKYPGKAEIVELGIVVVEPRSLKILRTVDVKVMPNDPSLVSPEAAKINGFDFEKWKAENAISQTEALKLLIENVDPEGIIWAWHMAFDWSVIELVAYKNKIELPLYRRECVMSSEYTSFYDSVPEMKSQGLRNVAKQLGIPYGDTHKASEDALIAFEIFKKLIIRN